MTWVLSVDFGTSSTAAAMGRDGGAQLVGVDGGLPRMLSNVFWQESTGRLLGTGGALKRAIPLLGGLGLSEGERFTVGSAVALALGFVLVMGLNGLVNVGIERVAYRPLRNAPKLAPLITAVGFSFILQNVGLLWLGGSQQGVPDLIRGRADVFTVAGLHVARDDLLAIGITLPLYLLLTAQRSRDMLRTARVVIVDEIHAVLQSRRGAHLALTLERLDHICGRKLQRIGIAFLRHHARTRRKRVAKLNEPEFTRAVDDQVFGKS